MKEEPILNGIHCDVTNCVHNNGHCCCTADEITVSNDPMHAKDGICETFSEL